MCGQHGSSVEGVQVDLLLAQVPGTLPRTVCRGSDRYESLTVFPFCGTTSKYSFIVTT